jgi:fido (protein-threonine AMPylation protein)
VGSPAGRLESLSREIFSLRERSGPVSLWAIVAMVRLLQVHPFADGNGRTARLYACWAAQRGLGGSDLFPGIVSALWMRANFCVNAACIAVRDHEEWTPLLERCLDAAAQWAPRSPRHALPGPLPGTPAFPAGHGLR